MRSKKALINIVVSLILQVVTIVCGFIIPRLIITTYGSGVNGLTASISQFLAYIVLLEAGVGGVVRAALYKPLAEKDINSVSRVIKATKEFFKKIAFIFIAYLIIISFIFPFAVKDEFSSFFTTSLILIIGVSTFFQYYFGISYQILLQADQKRYTASVLQILTIIANSVLVIILIKLGAGIHVVKLGSSFIFILRPVLLSRYVNKKYKIIKDCEPDNKSLKQKWDGLGHHIAFLLHDNTDIAVLTIFANIKEVSVYSVYYMIVSGIRGLTATFSSGIEAAFGNMIARNEKSSLDKNFRLFEFLNFSMTTILFTSTTVLILPFVLLYTGSVTDANYYRPVFAYILIAAEAVFCIRIPYNSVVLAAGHFKQTRNGAFAEAGINIILSAALVNYLGIEGVAIGTLAAMTFRTIQYAVYLSKNILNRSMMQFFKRILVYSAASLLIIVAVNLFSVTTINTIAAWTAFAVEVVIIAFVITILAGEIFYPDDMKNISLIIKRALNIPQRESSITRKKVLAAVLSLVLIVAFGISYYSYSSLNKIKKVDLPENDEELGISSEFKEEKSEYILNIAFFGLDAREPDLASRSDTIMVVSIDSKNEKVKVTSLMRDMYVPIPGRRYDNRINAAYAYGGPVLALKTINSNFNLDIKNFVTINFFGMEDLINKIGGVKIYVKKEEVKLTNVKYPGLQLLDGEQALAYARIRHVGNNDYERTERQRRILNEIFKTIKSQGILKLPVTVAALLPYVETNLSNSDILKLASDVIKFNTENIEQFRLPVNGTFKSEKIRGMAVLVPNINKNKKLLHEFIYGTHVYDTDLNINDPRINRLKKRAGCEPLTAE